MNTMILTETEFSKIDAVRAQLCLVADLLSAKGANSGLIDASDLYEFLNAQESTLRAVKAAVNQRCEWGKDTDNVMNWLDWNRVIGVVSGLDTMTGGQLKDMTRKLQRCVQATPDMAYVLNAWMEVMTQGGTLPFILEPNSTDGFNIRFEPVTPVQQSKAKPAKKTA